jgi:hypothetical protein
MIAREEATGVAERREEVIPVGFYLLFGDVGDDAVDRPHLVDGSHYREIRN